MTGASLGALDFFTGRCCAPKGARRLAVCILLVVLVLALGPEAAMLGFKLATLFEVRESLETEAPGGAGGRWCA